ncbi:hypothetical protein D3C77_192650 [compost metagenome]
MKRAGTSPDSYFAEIAGTEFFSLLEDLDEIEEVVRATALYHQFHEHYQDAFKLAGHAASYWLEEDGTYADVAAGLIQEMFRLRDVIYDHFSYAEASSLPRVLSSVMNSSG